MRALFIGRFQPFHLGHLSVLKDIDKNEEIKEIIIGVGSSQYFDTEDNPYSFSERELMINRSLKNKINKPYKIIAIPDIHNEVLWVDHVAEIVGNFDIVYTGNSWVEGLFKKKNYKVGKIDFKIKISGTKLREMIKNKDENWQKFVPESIISLILK